MCILLGALALHHPDASHIRYWAQQLAAKCNGSLSMLTDGANTAGGWLAGAIPHRHAGGEAANYQGLSAYDMLEKPRKGYILLNVEPELDCANAWRAIEALKQAKFVVAVSMYGNPVLKEHAHVILPMAPFTETAGTFVNAAGDWQSFQGAASPFGASRPAWKILRVMGNFLHGEGFDYESVEEVKHEVEALVKKMPPLTMQFSPPTVSNNQISLSRIGEIPIYAVDSLVRRSTPLQEAQVLMEGEVDVVRIHSLTAKKLKLTAGNKVKVKQQHGEAILTVIWDDRIAEDAVWVAGSRYATSKLGDLMAPLR